MAAGVVSIALVGTMATEANAAPQPRISAAQCGATASSHTDENGYVVVDPATNTSCTTNENGTFLWLGGTTVKKGRPVKIVARMLPTTRGDVRPFARVYFIRGKTVIRKRVYLGRGGLLKLNQKLNKKGTWTIVAVYRGNRLSGTTQIV